MGVDRPHYLEHRQRLRKRFLTHGLEGFADYEVVELLLTLAFRVLMSNRRPRPSWRISAIYGDFWMRPSKTCRRCRALALSRL
jgi:hypothetical protein